MRSRSGPLLLSDTSPRAIRRCQAVGHLLPFLAFAAMLLADAAPVSAAALAVTSIRADFDNDGLMDTVSVVNDGRSSQVRVWLSHRARSRILRIPDEVVAVVATDINADGRVDVQASTRRHGVFVWVNHGRGRLRRVKPASPTLTAKHRFGGPGPLGPSSFARSLGDDDPPSGSLPDLQRSPYNAPRTTGAAIRSPDIVSPDDFSNTPPRAPPSN